MTKPKKIVVACDSFKGCLSAAEVSTAVADALKKICGASCQVVVKPVADGGEGTTDALAAGCQKPVQWVTCMVDAPLPELPQIEAQYAIDSDGTTAYMELAQASGLPLVPRECRDVMRSSTLGTGQMMLDAVERGCTHLVMGLGGSATCDGGMGVLAALGVEFVDSLGHELMPCAANLGHVAEIDCRGLRDDMARTRVTLVTDVTNPLCGPLGAARVFAPQKGATPHQVELIECGMRHYAKLLGDSSLLPGAGAAGGVAAALTAMLPRCTITAGATFVIEHIGLADAVRDADLVITGEGHIDRQTAMGKAPQAVAELARSMGVPVVAVCGAAADDVDARSLGFERIVPITPPDMPLQHALQPEVARQCIAHAVADCFEQII